MPQPPTSEWYSGSQPMSDSQQAVPPPTTRRPVLPQVVRHCTTRQSRTYCPSGLHWRSPQSSGLVKLRVAYRARYKCTGEGGYHAAQISRGSPMRLGEHSNSARTQLSQSPRTNPGTYLGTEYPACSYTLPALPRIGERGGWPVSASMIHPYMR